VNWIWPFNWYFRWKSAESVGMELAKQLADERRVHLMQLSQMQQMMLIQLSSMASTFERSMKSHLQAGGR
jgi:hypothetical protein